MTTGLRGWLRGRSLTARIALGSAAVSVVVIAAFVPQIGSLTSARDADAAEERSDDARAQAAGILGLVVDLETGQRGFLLTAEERFLEPWRMAMSRLPTDLRRLKSLVQDDRESSAQAAAVARQIESYIEDYSEPSVARARRDLPAAIRVVKSGEGKRRVDGIRAAVASLDETIATRARRRRDRQAAAQTRAVAFAAGGFGLSLGALALLAMFLRSAIASPVRRLTEGAERIGSGDLSTRVDDGGSREFSELAQTFNAMGASLQWSMEELSAARAEADRANAAKSEFLSRMSHELRTPLNAILGFGQLLEMDDLDTRQRESVEQILKAGRHLLDLINEVLEISRIEAGVLTISMEPVHAATAVSDAVELGRPLATAAGLALSADYEVAGDRYVCADQQRLKQVLLNLISNAVKYNREGGTIAVSFAEGAEGRLRIVVSDTGCGMSPEQLDRLFDPFDRLGAEQTDVEGTGLGLALSKRLIDAMGGAIWAESEPGVGTKFFVELALETDGPAERHAATATAAASNGAPLDIRSSTILYIEDNLSNFKLIDHVFADRPAVELVPAMQGEIGLELARQHGPDLILLDLHLPGMPGNEVLRRLKAEPATREIPVVVLSADATDRQVERVLAAGAHAYLTKPLDIERFLDVVNDTLGAEAAEAR